MQPPPDDEQNRALRINDLVISRFRFPLASVEFSGARSDWAVLILSIVVLITCLIGLAAGEIVRDRPKGH